MVIGLKLLIAIASVLKLVVGITVDITILPKLIRLGNDLQVNCSVRGDPIDKSFKTLLKCPFNADESFCISNCDSLDKCTETSCNRKMVRHQSFQCELYETPTSLIYSYRFIAISNSNIQSKYQLDFICQFKGQQASGVGMISNVTAGHTESAPVQPYESTSTISTIFDNFSSLKIRDIILISLVLSLFMSFLINVWCCVHWCIRRSRNRNMKRKLQSRSLPRDNGSNINCYEQTSQYNSRDNMKRIKSNHTLPNDDKSTQMRLISNSTGHSSPGSTNHRPKYKNSSHNIDDFDNGSNNSLLPPHYGPMVRGPFQCVDPSMFSYMATIPHPYVPLIQMNSENISLQNNFDPLIESRLPEHQNFFKKPDEVFNDRDSVFN